MSHHWLSTLFFLIAVLLANIATAAGHWDEMRVMHSWNDIPANWEIQGNTTAGAMIQLHFALKPDQANAMIGALYEVSNPDHPRYGAYLSKEQAEELVSPHPDTVELVRAWLVHHGIRPSSISTTHGGSWVTATDVLVSQANQLLSASYQLYQNSKTNDTIIRTVSYALPKVLHAHIQTVEPTTYFPSTRMRQTLSRRSFGTAPAQAGSGKVVPARQLPGLTPSSLRWYHSANIYKPAIPDKNTIGILGMDNDYPNQWDLTHFMAMYRSDAIEASFTVEQWNGGRYSLYNPGEYANLGVQYAAAIAYPTPLIFYSVGGGSAWNGRGDPIAGDMYLEWLNRLLAESSPPQTISIGYGEIERELPPGYARSICRLFAQLGSRGVTVLVASGKDGVGDGDCITPHGNFEFMTEFPSTCPYVTSVGGTTNFRPEIAANLSGGGFSFYFDTPEYQLSAVVRYLRLYPNFYDGLFDRGGRGYPDISAQALNYQYIRNGDIYYMDGTTCSVSTVAGLVSLVNDYRISRSKPTLGFLNPLLYSHVFRGVYWGVKDTLYGGNPGCGTSGFVADIGWDPATGLGTLNFTGMLRSP